MSTAEPSTSFRSNSSAALTSLNVNNRQTTSALAQNSNPEFTKPTPTSSRTSRTDQLNSTETDNGPIQTSDNAEGGGNVGLGSSTPLPPAQPPASQHAQMAPSPRTMTQAISESPLSVTSSGPPVSPPFPAFFVPPVAPPPQRTPSPPPPPPPSLRPAQVADSRSNTGTNVPLRSLSFVDARVPSRTASTSARANNEYGPGYSNNGNGNRNVCRNCERRTMSSITTSMEKAGVLSEQDNPRVYQVDLGYSDRLRDSRYYSSGGSIPMTMTSQERMDLPQNTRQNGGGGDGNGKSDAVSPDRSTDSIGIPRFPRTVQERLQPTINHAMAEELKYARKARLTGYALNCAIGLQVFISALITALSAVTAGRRTQIMTSVLGGLGTIVASYLARARGSNEPELSITRTKDLQRFVRACDAFVQDHGRETGFEDTSGEEGKEGGMRDLRRARELDDRIRELRNELEHLLGHGDGERKLAPPV